MPDSMDRAIFSMTHDTRSSPRTGGDGKRHQRKLSSVASRTSRRTFRPAKMARRRSGYRSPKSPPNKNADTTESQKMEMIMVQFHSCTESELPVRSIQLSTSFRRAKSKARQPRQRLFHLSDPSRSCSRPGCLKIAMTRGFPPGEHEVAKVLDGIPQHAPRMSNRRTVAARVSSDNQRLVLVCLEN